MIAGELTGCVIVSGMPAAGKSTVTRLAARMLPRAAQIKADDLNEMILGGRVGYLHEPADEALRQAELCNRNLCALANNFIDFGFTVLMDQLLENRSELDFLTRRERPTSSSSTTATTNSTRTCGGVSMASAGGSTLPRYPRRRPPHVWSAKQPIAPC